MSLHCLLANVDASLFPYKNNGSFTVVSLTTREDGREEGSDDGGETQTGAMPDKGLSVISS